MLSGHITTKLNHAGENLNGGNILTLKNSDLRYVAPLIVLYQKDAAKESARFVRIISEVVSTIITEFKQGGTCDIGARTP